MLRYALHDLSSKPVCSLKGNGLHNEKSPGAVPGLCCDNRFGQLQPEGHGPGRRQSERELVELGLLPKRVLRLSHGPGGLGRIARALRTAA